MQPAADMRHQSKILEGGGTKQYRAARKAALHHKIKLTLHEQIRYSFLCKLLWFLMSNRKENKRG
jgi:hypothetical protein